MKFKSMFNQLYSPADETSGGGGAGEASGAAGGTGEQVDVGALKAELEKLRNHSQTLLSEKKQLAERLKGIEKSQEEAAQQDAEKANNFKQLFEITKSKLSKLEEEVKVREARDNEMASKVLRTKQEDAFKKELGAELVSDDFLKLVEWDKIVPDPEIADRIEFNKDGLNQAVEAFKNKYGSAVLKLKDDSNAIAAKGTKTANTDDFAQRVKKAGLI